jgi:hypothetical protein
MHTVIRQYSGENAGTLFDQLEARKQDVEQIIRDVPGFVSYTLVRTSDGGVSVTVCNDKAGADESSRRAAEWVKENMTVKVAPPEIFEGGAILHLT